MLHIILQTKLRAAIAQVLPTAEKALPILVRPCPDVKFGDYQSNSIIGLAKLNKLNPRQLATDVVAQLDVLEWCEKVEIAGPGFLNFRLKKEAMAQTLREAADGKHLFVAPVDKPRTLVVDFSSPNVAKPMHVGHIRSTILGDCLARVLRTLGHRVITDNHIGDWGTQFGMLLVGWKGHLNRAALQSDPMGEMERLYKLVNSLFKEDEGVKVQARQELVKLQDGDAENLAIWKEMLELSQGTFNQIYKRLGVAFDHALGESFYNPLLKDVVRDLQERGIACESKGAVVVFFEEPELKETPALIQKSDGAANYTTTDLATVSYRERTWSPDEVIYVTDARQQLHFKQFFTVFQKWHAGSRTVLSHVWFGMILGDDNKPFKTRTGENIKLVDLLDEAEARALAIVKEKSPELSEAEQQEIARVVGIGAIKYSDLLPNRQSDYVFNWEKMLAFNGNTAPYLQYACARINSIFRKAAELPQVPGKAQFALGSEAEVALARHLLNFGVVLEAVADDYRPNYLCNYLYDLAGHFSRFFENCPVLKSEGQERVDRLEICRLTRDVMQKGLGLLGIETTERM